MSYAPYRLFYFEARGRAEPCRFLFALAGVEYEDVRLNSEAWAKKKPEMPFGKMPVLEVHEDGKPVLIPQSMTIERFLAKEFGMHGKNNLEAARIDAIVDQMSDVFKSMPFFEKDEEVKKQKMEAALAGIVKDSLNALEGMVNDHNVFVGESITLADIELLLALDSVTAMTGCKTLLDDKPKLKAVYDRVLKDPKIVEWYKKRPETQY